MAASNEDEEIAFMRGEGGAIWPMALPLDHMIAERAARGEIVRVNEDGSDYVPSKGSPSKETEDPEKPKQADSKARWVDYAVSTGQISKVDADDLTKAELVERFG